MSQQPALRAPTWAEQGNGKPLRRFRQHETIARGPVICVYWEFPPPMCPGKYHFFQTEVSCGRSKKLPTRYASRLDSLGASRLVLPPPATEPIGLLPACCCHRYPVSFPPRLTRDPLPQRHLHRNHAVHVRQGLPGRGPPMRSTAQASDRCTSCGCQRATCRMLPPRPVHLDQAAHRSQHPWHSHSDTEQRGV